MSNDLSEIDVVILCGGLGTRLKSVVFNQPKVLARIGDKSFIDIIIDNLLSYGFKNIILSVGYMKEQIKEHFNRERDHNIIFSEEEELLGTGGALNNARGVIRSNPFMVMNGDSICEVDIKSFFDFHIERSALLSIVLARSKTAKDYGSVTLDASQRITSFNEKISGGNDNLVNAGIYLMKKDIFSYMPDQDRFSLEYDLFPQIIADRCYGFLTKGELIDIGTPERYERAIEILKNNNNMW